MWFSKFHKMLLSKNSQFIPNYIRCMFVSDGQMTHLKNKKHKEKTQKGFKI